MRSFEEMFGVRASADARAPGRVNLLGEHTDYNEGYVLPTTIPHMTRVQIAPAPGAGFVCCSVNFDECVEFDREAPAGFARYIYGCVATLRERGDRLAPVIMRVQSDIPIGKGLSSSAALEVAVLRALRQLFALTFDDVELALLAQRAEVQYAGVRCGILDQMASSLGCPGQMLFLDTRTLQRKLLALPLGAEIVVIDSGVARELSSTAYNQRRRECERAAQLLGVVALRDIDDFALVEQLPQPLDRRSRHVLSENQRVLEASAGVSAARFGQLMNESHTSLKVDYEVSIGALDELATLLQSHPSVYGARLTGAGFGGACVALVERRSAEQVRRDVVAAYAAKGYQGQALV
jgi:galactokinase